MSRFVENDCYRSEAASPYFLLLFSPKIFFQKENIQFSNRRFFIFLKLPMTRRVLVCRVGVLYNTIIGCHRGSEAGDGGFESRY